MRYILSGNFIFDMIDLSHIDLSAVMHMERDRYIKGVDIYGLQTVTDWHQ